LSASVFSVIIDNMCVNVGGWGEGTYKLSWKVSVIKMLREN